MGEKRHRRPTLKRILVLVEGSTEERFIKDVLSSYLLTFNVVLIPTITDTKKVIGGQSNKGGGRHFAKVKADILDLLSDKNAVAVTTMFDFYGFYEIQGATQAVYADIEKLEQTITAEINNRRFLAYLQRHEFEAFMFIEPALTAKVALRRDKANAISAHRQQFNQVEDINLDTTLAPSKRLKSAIGGYSKPIIGAAVTNQLGIDKIMQECPKFAAWVNWMVTFAPEQE